MTVSSRPLAEPCAASGGDADLSGVTRAAVANHRRAPQRCSICLAGVQVLADIGVYPHEIGRKQPLVVRVELTVTTPVCDSMGGAFDYVQIKDLAESLADERIVLIETFARRLAELCLQHHLVLGAAVTVEKPLAVPSCMASATVKLGDVP